ncbi:MAG: hypothetical protein K8S98_01510 [Planctomycetes bacterium]|nr:hypothetical protein [Planctomycetota bacterium]
MRSPADSRRGLLWLAVAIVAYAVLRGLVLVDAFDGTALTTYELYPMGTIPKVWPEGHSLPLRDYYDNAAAHILTGLLAIPFYETLGPSYFALKLVPATLGLLALVLTFFFARTLFGPKAAAVSALLFALGTTTSVKYSLMASGNHFENVLFSLAALVAFGLCHRGGCTKSGLMFAGFAIGFSIFVFLGALLPAVMYAFVHVGLRGWKRSLADARFALLGLALGVAPLVLLNLGHDSRGLEFLDKRFGVDKAKAAEGVLARLVHFYTEHLHVASRFTGWVGLSGRVADFLYLAGFLGAWFAFLPGAVRDFLALCRGIFRARGVDRDFGDAPVTAVRAVLVPLFFYMPACSLAYAFSDLKLGAHEGTIAVAGYRYFLLHFAFVCLLVAAAVERWTAADASRGQRVAAWSCASALLLAGLFNFGILKVNATPRGVGWSYEGYSYAYLSRGLLSTRNRHSQTEVIARIETMPTAHRARVYWGIGHQTGIELGAKAKGIIEKIELAQALEGWPERYLPDVARGFGSFLRPFDGDLGHRGTRVANLISAWIAKQAPYAEQVAEGLCLPWDPPLATYAPRLVKQNIGLVRTAPAELRPAMLRGAGMFLGRLLGRGHESDLQLVRSSLPRFDDSQFYELCYGMGFAMLDGCETPRLSDELIAIQNPKHRASAWDGFADGLEHLYVGTAREPVLAQLRPRLPADLIERLTKP